MAITIALLTALFSKYAIWIVIAAAVSFAFYFAWPAIRINSELKLALLRIPRTAESESELSTAVEQLTSRTFTHPYLRDAWTEYRKTLHRTRTRPSDPLSAGEMRYRSTTSAIEFFHSDSMIDGRLKIEFFKHLPGILTGFGIISTFAGLISGLAAFGADSNPLHAQSQLHRLIAEVGTCFQNSFFAILFAIIITVVEKMLYAQLIYKINLIRESIDRLFEGGVGEEYLLEVKASVEQTNVNIANIKDSLINDLKVMLIELVEQHHIVENQRAEQLPAAFGKAIATHIGAPIEEIAKAVGTITTQQGDAVNSMLAEALSRFTNDMRSMFGDQLRGVAELLEQTTQKMNETALHFEQLTASIGVAGDTTVASMRSGLTDILSDLADRQRMSNETMLAFVERLGKVTEDTQRETGMKTNSMLESLGARFEGLFSESEAQHERLGQAQTSAQQRFEEQSGNVLTNLSSAFAENLEANARTNALLAESIDSINRANASAITSIQAAAGDLERAVVQAASAHRDMANVFSGASAISGDLRTASGAVVSATGKMSEIAASYEASQTHTMQAAETLRAIVDIAKREAGMSQAVSERLEECSQTLRDAYGSTDQYMTNVHSSLVDAHESFAAAIGQTLRTSNAKFAEELQTLVTIVHDVVSEFGDKLDELRLVR